MFYTVLGDVKCLGEGLQKISWTLLKIKTRKFGKNLPPPESLVLELGSLYMKTRVVGAYFVTQRI